MAERKTSLQDGEYWIYGGPQDKNETPIFIPNKSHLIVSQTAGNISYPGGSLQRESTSTKSGLASKKKVVRAHHIAEKNREIAQLLSTHNDQMIPEKDETPQEPDSEKRRKLARMEALRQKQGTDNKSIQLWRLKQKNKSG